MLIRLEEHKRYAEITGFREVQIENTKEIADAMRCVKERDTVIQFLNAELVATWEHLFFALLNAVVGFESDRNISKSLGVEIMLYASAQNQIRKAIDLVGVKNGCVDLAVVVVGSNEESVETALSAVKKRLGKEPDESVLELFGNKAEKIRGAFGINESEIEATTSDSAEKTIVNLIIERMALLATTV